jgi:hypothetical protein
MESKILYFVYTYLSYINYSTLDLQKDNLFLLWSAFLKFFKCFSLSKNPNTMFWLLELVHMLALKYNPKEALADNNFKKSLHDEVNNLICSISTFCSKGFMIFFNDPLTSLKDKEQTEKALPRKYPVLNFFFFFSYILIDHYTIPSNDL